ncbi:polyprenyl synthetase family protein [Isoptericola sp. b441]|uniref:Polyprenyl synthetase family protein n=1 Tax=Actinotalea lenta TaxID=3064654 RepID=A0ABT9D4Y3_9CELL|nr:MULTISPECIES: polyprenyl synthetase family protein [unclassified Isoptericola]MDO8105784.1 polyprenyl synthetase family protein [Isoptericola sp. b441]MDO8122489.1 polyprenyl synthetase family protein [Isoptericola sp. b490]
MTALPLADTGLADRLTDRLARVETRLVEAASHADHLADATSRHLVSAGGKRLRPLLTLLTAELGDGADPRVLDAAVVVELTHLATLYHDDVMDSAPVRRGAPAAHEVWGNQVAILTGDLLLAKASALTAVLGPQAVLVQAQTFERLCLGQLHETVGPADGVDPVDHYLQVLADKTGSLIATSARYGALFGGCPPEVVDVVTTYGEKIGLAFQLADDVIDLTDDGGLTGKRPGTDLREHVPTMPVLLLRRLVGSGAGTAEDRRVLDLLDGDLSDDADLAAAVRALREHEVTERTRLAAEARANEAVDALGALPEGPVRDSLVLFARSLVERSA